MLRRNLIIGAALILLLASSATAVYFYSQWKKATTVPSQTDEINEVLSVVSQYMELPQGETPTIATVIDKEKLKDQQFFIHAENGDKVLIYTNSKKAILYRPTTKKVVEVAPIYFDDKASGTASDASTTTTATVVPPVQTVKIAYYNGSGKPGRAAEIESQTKAKFSNTETISLGNTKAEYTGVVVIDLTGNMSVEVDGIAKLLNGTVGQFPNGEERPQADILIIAGK